MGVHEVPARAHPWLTTRPSRRSEPAGEASRPRRRWLRRVLIGLGACVVALVALGALLYGYGSMWVPDPAMKAAHAELVAAGAAEPVEARFHVPIPGCVCHSDDPVQTMQHSTYRIRECSNCHERVGPQ